MCCNFSPADGLLDTRPEDPDADAAGRLHRSEQAEPMYEQAGLDAGGIVARVFAALGKDLDTLDAGAEVVRLR